MAKKENYWEKYRGFEVIGKRDDNISRFNAKACTIEKVGGIAFDIFDIEDKIHSDKLVSFSFAFGYDITDGVDGDFEHAVKKLADNQYYNLSVLKEEKAKERKIRQLSMAVSWISKNEEGETLYNILSKELGLSDYDIVNVGHTELLPYFDLEKYAEVIADTIVREGTEGTSSGNWLTSFEEIKDEFGVDLVSDKEMVDHIENALYSIYGDVICEMDIHDNEFDIMYFLNYCPNAEED